jgi:hypothetical protein
MSVWSPTSAMQVYGGQTVTIAETLARIWPPRGVPKGPAYRDSEAKTPHGIRVNVISLRPDARYKSHPGCVSRTHFDSCGPYSTA